MPRVMSWLLPLAAALVGGMLPQAGATPATGAARATTNLDWPQFLHDPSHSSVSPTTAFTTANAASATVVWHWTPPAPSGSPTPHLDASPTVADGSVFIGVEDSNFYALNESTGAMEWSMQLDTCPGTHGVTATAAVEPDPVTGTPTVYVAGAHDLYALNAATGEVVWQTRIAPAATNPHLYYNWSSPLVMDGHVYEGIASGCGGPPIQGQEVELDQQTGQVLNTWDSVPDGSIGGGVWSSIVASPTGHGLWVGTGSDCSLNFDKTCPPGNKIGHAISIVHLSPSLKFLQAWQLPNGANHDWDFGASPTLFGGSGGAPTEVGDCNKDGSYYALQSSPLGKTPLWTDALGTPAGTAGECVGAAIWDKATQQLFLPGGSPTTINGTTYGGSINEVNPATGAYIWQTGLPCAEIGSPSADSAGVLAVGTWSCTGSNAPGAYLVNAATGAILTQLPTGRSRVFGQPVFAQGDLFVAAQTGGLYAFAPDHAGQDRL
jgi:outer membrane protein assembly factor BamB